MLFTTLPAMVWQSQRAINDSPLGMLLLIILLVLRMLLKQLMVDGSPLGLSSLLALMLWPPLALLLLLTPLLLLKLLWLLLHLLVRVWLLAMRRLHFRCTHTGLRLSDSLPDANQL